MRLLFEIDKRDYDHCTHQFVRNSARAIVIRNGTIAMIHSLQYDYYKFPGGGIEKDEFPIDALIRESKEEAGLVLLPETIKEYGYVHRIHKSDTDPTECFIQDNYYYLCEARNQLEQQTLDVYEADEGYTPVFIDPHTAISKNRSVKESPHNPIMYEREARVLELLIAEGYFR